MREQKAGLKIRMSIVSSLIAVFCALTALVFNGGIAAFERGVYIRVVHFMDPAITAAMTALSDAGYALSVIVISAALLILPFTRKKFGYPVAVTVMLSAALNHVLKLAIARPRPDVLRLVVETGYGFPSGHSMNNAALYTMLALVACRQAKSIKLRLPIVLFSAAMPFLIGISRIYLGVHNAADVLAGWALGSACALSVDTLWLMINSRDGLTALEQEPEN